MFRKTFGTLFMLLAISVPARAQRAACDGINLADATITGTSVPDIASWPVTTAISRLDMSRPAGLAFTFSAQSTWPDYTPPGWNGPLQYTVWAFVKINGHWYGSGFIQMWRGRASTGAPILTDFARNWVYSTRWGAMYNYQPVVGEQMGFMVSAGNARDQPNVTSVRQRSNLILVNLPANDTGTFTFSTGCARTGMDADGDGKDDIGVYRPSTGQWLGLASSTNFTTSAGVTWGVMGDILVPGDYDGDGKMDVAVYRPSTSTFFVLTSSSGYTQSFAREWGAGWLGDVPVPRDYDGDGKTDIAVWRPSTGFWYVLTSSSGFTQSFGIGWGAGSAKDVPVPADYDGDGRADLAVWRPSTGMWYVLTSRSNYSQSFGLGWGSGAAKDVPVPGDYDGDGRTDIAVWRPSTGIWYVLTSRSNYAQSFGIGWGAGAAQDIPVIADYDGDGKTDLTVWRPATGTWFVLTSSSNYAQSFAVGWGSGTASDVPVGAARIPQ